MAAQSTKTLFLILLSIAIMRAQGALNVHYYDQSCPQAEYIVAKTVLNASIYDPKVPPRLLRMFFHDCFIRGCDASILLDSTPGNKAEKDGPPNISIRSFYVIDDAKAKLEKACPQTVSCADTGGPYWKVPKGRKDGRVSKASDTTNLPPPTLNTTQLIQSFANRGLNIKDLVALSGAHTLGFSHCSSFVARIHNFSKLHDIDPSINAEFGSMLKKKCPRSNRSGDAGQFLDSTSSKFDNNYYKQIVAGKGVFTTDQGMYHDQRTRSIIQAFAKDQSLFFREFVASMIKLGNVGVKEVGEVRLNCKRIN
ncbi:Peroxidase 66 [Bienertia sinuspersici]